MDVLIVIGTTAAWLYGVILILIGYSEEIQSSDHKYKMQVHSHVHNFETSSVLILIVLLGKYIESYSKMKTVDKLSDLASLKVTKANLITNTKELNLNSNFKEVAVELLQKKDFVMVQPGGAVPTDGQVVYGRGCCNEAMLTGESQPVQKEIGLRVFGGTILTQGSIIVKVVKTSEDATFNQIMKLVENAQNSKAPIQGYADKISSYFVPVIVVLAIIDWIIWFSLVFSGTNEKLEDSYDSNLEKFQFAFDFGISSLVVACPCALGLATPTAVMVGTGLAASFGILIKGADILEKIQNIDTIVFDKTGTLTAGKPQVRDLVNCFDQFKIQDAISDNTTLYEYLYLCEKSSEHPIAVSICEQISKNIPNKIDNLNNEYTVHSFQNINGEGIIASITPKDGENKNIACGNMKLMKREGVLSPDDKISKQIQYLEEEGKTVIVLAIQKVPSLIISLEEAHLSKPESKYVIQYLQTQMKMKVCMITGDNKHSAIKVAKHLNIPIENVTYSAYPETKKKVVEKFQ